MVIRGDGFGAALKKPGRLVYLGLDGSPEAPPGSNSM
jgi:hypothetical protein